jgi:hypothetical protein
MATPRRDKGGQSKRRNAQPPTLESELQKLFATGTCADWAAREVLQLDGGPQDPDAVAAALHRALHRWEKAKDNDRDRHLYTLIAAAHVVLELMVD